MKVRPPFHLPEAQQDLNRRAKKLEWVTIGFLLSIIAVMVATMGGSQAMKAAVIEDLLGLVPPVVFLVADRYKCKPPDERYPYGYYRFSSAAFLMAAVSLFILGAYIFYDSAAALIRMEHPSFGRKQLFGTSIWSGWLMISALVYSAIPPVILGRKKLALAGRTNEKVLHTDAKMNKADWMTAVAGILGVAGVGLGFWWADAVMAGIISLDVLKDGIQNVKSSMEDLLDRRAVSIGPTDLDAVMHRIRKEVAALPWIREADLRLRDEGQLISGELFFVPAEPCITVEQIHFLCDLVQRSDWRLHDIVATAVASLE